MDNGAKKLRVMQDAALLHRECVSSPVYLLPSNIAVIDVKTQLYIIIMLNTDTKCSMEHLKVNTNYVPLNENDIVYVIPENKIQELQRFIPNLQEHPSERRKAPYIRRF